MACDTDLSSGTFLLEDEILEKYDSGPAPNAAGGVTLKIRNDLLKVPHENLQNTLKEHCMLLSNTTPTTSLASDRVNSNTFMLKLSDHQVVHSKLRRRQYSHFQIPFPGTVLSSVPQTTKLSHTNRDCVKSVNSTANIHNPDDRHGIAGSESGTSDLGPFHNSEQAHMNSQCGTTLAEERPSPLLSGNECSSHIRDDQTEDSHCPEFINSDMKTDDVRTTQRHLDSETQAVSSMTHQQQQVRKQEAEQVVLVEHGGDHPGWVGLSQIDITHKIETKEVPWQEEVLKPYCDCQISSFTDDMSRACTFSYQGFPVRLPHVSSVLILEHQLVTFVRNDKTHVSVCELKSKNMIQNFTKFSSLLQSQSSLLPLTRTEVEFLKQKGRVKDYSSASLVSLDHLRWIYRTQAAQQQDAFSIAVSQCPWYSLALGHSCRKVAMLNLTEGYICPLCFRVEQRPIEARTQRYECDLCFQANDSKIVPQSQMPNVNNYAKKTRRVERTSFVVREDGKLQTVIMGHIKVADKNVAAFCKGDVTYVSCRHLIVHLYQFPWEDFINLVKSLDLCFMEAPVMVCHFFQKLAYPQELVNGRVWCSVQNLRCIACFSVGQMNNTQYLEKNKILALIAQGKYVEEFPFDTREGETEKSITEPKRVLPSHEYQVHQRQISTTNSSAKKVIQAPPGKTVLKVDAAKGQVLVCTGDGKTIGNVCLPQTAGQNSMKVHDQRGLTVDASDGQRVVSGSVKTVGNLCQTRTVAQSRTRTDNQTGLNVNASVSQVLVGGEDVGNHSQTQTVAQNMTKQMSVNSDSSGQIMVVGNMTTSTRPSEPGIQRISGLTQSKPAEWSPIMPSNSVFCCEKSQIPGGNYFVKENMNFTDYKSESGLVFRVMKQPTGPQNKIDILSVAAEEIREVASKSEYTSDMDNSGFSNANNSSLHQNLPSTSFEQCSNLQQLTSEQTTQSVPGLPTNVGTVCKDLRAVEPAPSLSVNACDNNPSRPESDGQDKLLSMPVDFFQDSPVRSPKRKCFLSPNKMHEVTKLGGDVIVFQNEGGEHYECTALGPIDDLRGCLLVVSPEKAEKENRKTISPDSACSQKSVEGKSESCTHVELGPTTTINQSQNSSLCGEDNSSNAEQSGSGHHAEPLPTKGVKNIQSKTQQASRVTSSVDEEYKPDTSGVSVAQGMCFGVSPSTETKETEPCNMSPIKTMDTPFPAPTRLSVNSPNKSPVSSNIYKKLVTQCNSNSSLSVLASVAEAIDEDGDGKDADAKESSPLLQETQSNANSSISVEDEDLDSEFKEESPCDFFPEDESSVCDTDEISPLLQSNWNNTEILPEDRFPVCDAKKTSPVLKETESDIFRGDAEEASPLLQAKWNDAIIPDEDETVVKLAKCHYEKSSHLDCCSTSSHDERLSASATDHSGSSRLNLDGDSRSSGTSNSSIENEIEICTELDFQLKSLNQKQTVEKCSSVSDEQFVCSEDEEKCLAQMDGAQKSNEAVPETELLYCQDPEEGDPSDHQRSEDKAAELGLDARGNVDTDLVMDVPCNQLQIAEEIEENGSGNSRCFQGETEGTDLRHGDIVEPETGVSVSNVEPNTAVGVSSVEPNTSVDVSSVEPRYAIERKSKKRKRRQSFQKRIKRKKTVVSEMECMTAGLGITSSYQSSKAPSQNVTVAAESAVFSVCDTNQAGPVEEATFSGPDQLPKFTEAHSQHIPEEGALFSENTENELTTTKSPKFSSGGENDYISAGTLSPLGSATKEHMANQGREVTVEGLTEHAVGQMRHVLEKIQVDKLVVADNRLRFELKLHPSLHTHFKGETQQKLVDKLKRLVKIGYILQQRRQTADGDKQASSSMES